jgi:hypothetical protein
MNKTNTYIVIALFLTVVVGMFGYAAYQKKLMNDAAPTPAAEAPDAYGGITAVDVKHFYENGIHTLVGEVPMPTPCDILSAETAVGLLDGNPEVTLNLGVTNTAEMCAQVVTPQKFMVTAEAGANPKFHAHFNGRDIEINIIPALPGETPETFEMFLKG